MNFLVMLQFLSTGKVFPTSVKCAAIRREAFMQREKY